MRKMFLGIVLTVFAGMRADAGGQVVSGTADPHTVTRLFANLAGRWSCSGAFADGRPLSSDIVIALRADGRAVQYQHHDRPPNDFVQEALWGPDAQNNALVSVAFAGNAKGLGPQLFVAKTWSDQSVVFEARPLTSPLFAANRFTYTIESPSTLTMVWEIERKDGWSVGDHISCNRVP